MILLLPVIRGLIFFLGISLSISILFVMTEYLVGMFRAIPVFIPLGVFVIALCIIFFIDGDKK